MDEFFRSNKLKFESLCVALLLCTAHASADDLDSYAGYNYELSDFVAWMEDAIREKEIPGVALAIVSREGIMHMQTWGVRSIDTREAIHSDSVFRIASMSKTFAGTSAALLVDQNYQSWDTKLTDLFPSMNLGSQRSSSGITLKHVVRRALRA